MKPSRGCKIIVSSRRQLRHNQYLEWTILILHRLNTSTDCSSPTNSSASQVPQLSSIKLFWQTNEWIGDKSQSVLGEIAVTPKLFF
jgi:hypothetical protein